MRILVTNDDGIDSPGLHAIALALSRKHEVWVVAPESERSAMSHYISVKNPVIVREVAPQRFTASGSPADCVIVGMLGVMPEEPDAVVSGINIGPNLGTDIIYSGTVAAARQGSIMGKPSVAVSLDTFTEPMHFGPVADFVAENLETVVELWKGDHFLSINAPNRPEAPQAVEITRPSHRVYHDRLEEFASPHGEVYYFLRGAPVDTELAPGTDWHAISRGSISISPISIHPTITEEDETYKAAQFVVSPV